MKFEYTNCNICGSPDTVPLGPRKTAGKFLGIIRRAIILAGGLANNGHIIHCVAKKGV